MLNDLSKTTQQVAVLETMYFLVKDLNPWGSYYTAWLDFLYISVNKAKASK